MLDGGKMDINEFKKNLDKSWAKETSEDPAGWSDNNPACGHCLISAMNCQDNFGGEIIQGKFKETQPYYWHRLLDGTEIHLTSSHAPVGTVISEGKVRLRPVIERALRSSRPDVLVKYEILKKRINEVRGTH